MPRTTPASRRKIRQKDQRTQEEKLVESVLGFVSTQPGVTVETNPAGLFYTYGFNVTVPPGATDAEVVELGNRLLEVADATGFTAATAWQWLFGIYRARKLIHIVKSRDGRKVVCRMCGHIQGDELGDRCISCRTLLSE